MFQSYTRIQVPESKHISRIVVENFSRFFKNKEYACSEFSSNFERWHFRLFKSNTLMSIKLYRLNSKVDIALKTKVCVSDSTGKVIHSQSEDLFFVESRDQNVGHDVAVIDETSLKEVTNEPNDTLVITADISFYKMAIKEGKTMQSLRDYTSEAETTLSRNILQMYNKNAHTDVVIIVQGERINAHKTILCARSPVFAKMFQQVMTESMEKTVEIEDVSLTAMKELVDFIYTRVKMNYDFDTAIDVYYAADKYEVKMLQKMCCNIIIRHLDENNALRALQIADRHDDNILKYEVKQFINYKFKECVRADWWANFANEKSELYKDLKNIF